LIFAVPFHCPDMGLGKTIQSIAAMSAFAEEWPLLVLTPSSARYHWAAEFGNWLGAGTDKNKDDASVKEGDGENEKSLHRHLLKESQIHVLTSSRSRIFPTNDTKVVICSYGLAPLLIKNEQIVARTFRCAIVDESHMLKNKVSQRTSALMPILHATDRCILLSGTPALSRPAELWPQLFILGTERFGWWASEDDFIQKYVKQGGRRQSAELHTMLTGTVMIRRLKVDILKTLPKKQRERASLQILNNDERTEFKALVGQLRQGTGTLGKLARAHHAECARAGGVDSILEESDPALKSDNSNATTKAVDPGLAKIEAQLQQDISNKFASGRSRIQQTLASYEMTTSQRDEMINQLEGELRRSCEKYYQQRLEQERESVAQNSIAPAEEGRKALLSHLYSRTCDVKIPLVIEFVKQWIANPTKGKICIFAHHMSMLDAIRDKAGLSNAVGSRNKFIRIDGTTLPKRRQEQITAFQSDPSYRVALLGITAAGVAVTLTASSTVFFSELFWTPAIMVQAEDRCHRIGQQSRVRCIYLVARGTLDDVLYRLLEKKLQDIGEFVEGKQHLKLVVHKAYTTAQDFYSICDSPTLEASSDDEDDNIGDEDLDNDTPFDSDLQETINHLGEEEEKMLHAMEGEDEGDGFSGKGPEGTQKSFPALRCNDGTGGNSEHSAIDLVDDEESGNNILKGNPSPLSNAQMKPFSSNSAPPLSFDFQSSMADCKYYRIIAQGPLLGVVLRLLRHRLVVESIRPERQQRLGHESKPSVGDILTAVNGNLVPLVQEERSVIGFIRTALKQGAIELVFAEHEGFIHYYRSTLGTAVDVNRHSSVDVQPEAEGVIELLDDEDE
jgi:hypothetical protein